jgi:hypothetical protein
MQQITNLSDEADQIAKVVLADGSVATFDFVYLGAVERWAFSVSHPEIECDGMILCAGPNVLRMFRNTIPFGLGCYSTDGADPFYIEDFASGRITLYVLDASEVQYFEQNVYDVQGAAA